MAKNDAFWRHHLKKLIPKVFDNVFGLSWMHPGPFMSNDEGWEYHVRKFLQMVDSAFYMERETRHGFSPGRLYRIELPHSERTRKSTEELEDPSHMGRLFLNGLIQKTTDGTDWKNGFITLFYGSPNETHRLLVEDEHVSVRTCYEKAARFAYEIHHRVGQEQWDQDYDAYEMELRYRSGDIFRGLPNISLFKGLGGYH